MWNAAVDLARRLGRMARVCLLGLGCLAGAAVAQPVVDTSAPRAILVDFRTGKVLFEKNADQPTAPASLAKLMTLEVVFDRLKTGRLSLDDMLTVSEHARRSAGGASMALKPGSKVGLRDLIQGMIVQSGNDASIVVAEGLAGSVPKFAAVMNGRAKEIGLDRSRFTNPHGLTEAGQSVTMRDMARLAAHLIREYPEHYRIFGQEAFTFGGVTYRNRNPLLGLGIGADGLKTGQTAQAGFALVASAERNGRRLILAMNGLKSAEERAEEARKILEWGFGAPAAHLSADPRQR
jgi:D-alanyl-D-alanine carboxypeptidase (penicillin-binding protein 5/6)